MDHGETQVGTRVCWDNVLSSWYRQGTDEGREGRSKFAAGSLVQGGTTFLFCVGVLSGSIIHSTGSIGGSCVLVSGSGKITVGSGAPNTKTTDACHAATSWNKDCVGNSTTCSSTFLSCCLCPLWAGLLVGKCTRWILHNVRSDSAVKLNGGSLN